MKASARPRPHQHPPQPPAGLPCIAIPGGVEFAVLATPGSSKACIRGIHGTALKVALRSPPEKGRANEELIELLADWLDLPPRQVQLIRGAASRQKHIRITGIDAEQVQRKVADVE